MPWCSWDVTVMVLCKEAPTSWIKHTLYCESPCKCRLPMLSSALVDYWGTSCYKPDCLWDCEASLFHHAACLCTTTLLPRESISNFSEAAQKCLCPTKASTKFTVIMPPAIATGGIMLSHNLSICQGYRPQILWMAWKNDLKLGTIYPDHLQKWSGFCNALLIFFTFDTILFGKMRQLWVHSHYLVDMWKECPKLSPPLELIKICWCFVDFPYFSVIFTEWNGVKWGF